MTLTENQSFLLGCVQSTGRERADRLLQEALRNGADLAHIVQAKEKLGRAAIVYNLDPELKVNGRLVISSILRTKRLFNRFETDLFARRRDDPNYRTRIMVEYKLYGATQDIVAPLSIMDHSDRPIYAAVDYVGRPRSVGSLGYYGHVRLKLRDGVKDRCTLTPLDSYFVEREEVFTWDNLEGILCSERPGGYWYQHILDDAEPNELGRYIELQILGGVSLSRDVSAIYYPTRYRYIPGVLRKIRVLAKECSCELTEY